MGYGVTETVEENSYQTRNFKMHKHNTFLYSYEPLIKEISSNNVLIKPQLGKNHSLYHLIFLLYLLHLFSGELLFKIIFSSLFHSLHDMFYFL